MKYILIIGDGMADNVVGKDVAFEVDLGACRRDVGQQSGKILGAGIEQSDPVSGQELSGHALPDGPTTRRDRKWPTTVARSEPRCGAP